MSPNQYKNHRLFQCGLFTALLLCSLLLISSAQSQSGAAEDQGQAVSTSVWLPLIQKPSDVKISGPYVGQKVKALRFEGDLSGSTAIATRPAQPSLRLGDFSADHAAGQRLTDPAWQSQTLDGGYLSDPILNFNGIRTGANPHDPVGDVGTNHYIQMVNSAFAIFDKAGNTLAGPLNINTLWVNAGATGNCATNNAGDPIVLYDEAADRWMMSQFTGRGNTEVCMAVSRTADPVAGGWYLYEFDVGTFPDYLKFGVWPDGYYMSANWGSSSPLIVFDRANMLNGNPAGSIEFTVSGLSGLGGNVLLPSDHDGAEPPPVGAPNVFYRQVDGDNFGGPGDRVELYSFHTDWGNPAASSVTGPVNIALAAFDSDLCGFFSFACIPQPGTTTTLDPINEWPMWRLQYRNFGSHETLVGNFTVDVDGSDNAGIRWFELRNSGGTWSLHQQGTYAPEYPTATSFEHRWIGSIAMDKAGDIALAYSVSNSTDVFPSIRYAGRVKGDPLGLMPQGEVNLMAGAAAIGSSRWGDYSSLNVDPVDGCTFWYTNDYVTAAGARQTRIGTFRFESCAGTDLSISKGARPEVVIAGEKLLYDITVSNNGGNLATGVVVTDTLPLGVSYDTDTDSCILSAGSGPGGEDQLFCNLGDIPGGGESHFTIQVTVDSGLVTASGSGTLTNQVSVGSDQDNNPDNNSATVVTIVNELADLRVSKDCKPDRELKAGEEAICTMIVENLGPSAARDVTLIDLHLSDGTFNFGVVTTTTGSCTTTANPQVGSGTVSCDLGDLDAGETVTVTVAVTADGSYDINDQVTVSSKTPDPDPSNNQASDTVIVNELADLRVHKDCKPDRPLDAGEVATCTITVDNLGPSAARNTVAVDDYLSDGTFAFGTVTTTAGTCSTTPNPQEGSGTVTCELGDMPAGERVVIKVEVTADGPYDINDRVTVSSDTTDPNTENNEAEDTIVVIAVADLAISKSDSPDPVLAGEKLTYTIEVTNLGPSAAYKTIVEDVLPAGVTIDSATASSGTCQAGDPGDASLPTICGLGNLMAGATETVEIIVTVLPDSVGLLQNDAKVYSDSDDPDNANNFASTTTTVGAGADLKVSKVDSPDPVFAGERLAYDVTITNLGPSTARDVFLADTLPPQVSYMGATISNGSGTCVLLEIPPNTVTCDLNDLNPGEFVRVIIDTLVDIDVPDGLVIANTAQVSSAAADPNPANNTAVATTVVRTQADLEILKEGDIDITNPSWTVKYTIDVINHGASDAQNVVVVDDLPLTAKKVVYVFDTGDGACSYSVAMHRVTCNFGTLMAGDTISVEIYVDVRGSVGVISNVATVSSSTFDKDLSNNTARKDLYIHG